MKSQHGSEKFNNTKGAGKAQLNFLLPGQNKKRSERIYPKYYRRSRRVFVGLSGGVDSAVSAALLKKEGYEVTGVFIKAWDPSTELRVNSNQKYPCTWREDRRSAMRVAAILDIPFVTLDLEKEYKKEIVDYMINEYKEGKTPNPDVMCNKEIKFGHFLKWALGPSNDGGADFVATGHYSIKSEARNPKSEIKYGLLEGKDSNKDQSYFLWTLTPDQLKHVLFPIGHLQKSEVRKLAKKFGLPQATRKDSQGLCFLGKIDMKEFLSKYIKPRKGDVINTQGEVLGYHNGAVFFTFGERHGFTITKKGALDKPFYVVDKNISKNTITVDHKVESKNKKDYRPRSITKKIYLKDVNIMDENIFKMKKLFCRFRYRQPLIECRAEEEGSNILVSLETEEGISIGQSLVFYHNTKCLGGGIIEKVIK
jgi:tRNA-specific 2-thiouridylase